MILKQLKMDRIYLLKIIKLFEGETRPVELMKLDQYQKRIEKLEEKIKEMEHANAD